MTHHFIVHGDDLFLTQSLDVQSNCDVLRVVMSPIHRALHANGRSVFLITLCVSRLPVEQPPGILQQKCCHSDP